MTRKLCTFSISAVLVLFALSSATTTQWIPFNGIQATEEEPAVEILSCDYNSISLNINVTGFNTETVETDGGTFSRISLLDYGYTNQTGRPQLPVIRRMVEAGEEAPVIEPLDAQPGGQWWVSEAEARA